MKCLKNQKTGDIIRVDDNQANQMEGITWKYIAKSEWKSVTRKSESIIKPTKTISDSIIRGYEGETISKKQARRAKFRTDETKD